MYSFISKNKFEKLVHLVGFILRTESITNTLQQTRPPGLLTMNCEDISLWYTPEWYELRPLP